MDSPTKSPFQNVRHITTLKKRDFDENSKNYSPIEKSVTVADVTKMRSTAEEIILNETSLIKQNRQSDNNSRIEQLRKSAFDKTYNKTFSSIKQSKDESSQNNSYIQMNAKLSQKISNQNQTPALKPVSSKRSSEFARNVNEELKNMEDLGKSIV